MSPVNTNGMESGHIFVLTFLKGKHNRSLPATSTKGERDSIPTLELIKWGGGGTWCEVRNITTRQGVNFPKSIIQMNSSGTFVEYRVEQKKGR